MSDLPTRLIASEYLLFKLSAVVSGPNWTSVNSVKGAVSGCVGKMLNVTQVVSTSLDAIVQDQVAPWSNIGLGLKNVEQCRISNKLLSAA